MKQYFNLAASLITGLLLLITPACSSDEDDIIDNNIVDVVEGPSKNDVLSIPTDAAYLGDSIRYMRTYALSTHPIKKVSASTTQNGHIAVFGGYKEQTAIYIYAKADNESIDLSDERAKAILEKYYNIESYANDTEIVANVSEKSDVTQGTDYRKLRVSIKIFTPESVSTALSIAKGSIMVKNIGGNNHTAKSISGSIKYIDSSGRNYTVESESGYIGMINTSASESMNTKLSKGNIQLVLPKDTKATLDLQSSTNINAYILNSSNFKGTTSKTKVQGKLNGGGFQINSASGMSVIVFRWYENNEKY
jgi:hypothetical protein